MTPEQAITYDFDRLLKQYPSFFDQLIVYVNDVRKYGTVKQAIEEAEKRLEKAKAADTEFQVELKGRQEAMEAEHKNRQGELDAVLKAHKADIDHQMIVARNEVNKVIEDGQKQKDRILAEANVARAAVDQRVEDARKQALELEGAIGDMNAQIQDLETTILAKQAELSKINDAIAAVRAKIA